MLNIVCALLCEAKPLIQKLNLSKEIAASSSFSIYRNPSRSINLIISGIGPINIASATTYLHAYTHYKPKAIFLNLGIAGSKEFPIGKLVIAKKLSPMLANNIQRSCYPYINFKFLRASTFATCYSTEVICHQYPEYGMIDMEALAFFQVANNFVNKEYIQVIKIISDTCSNTRSLINEKLVVELVNNNIDKIIDLIENLQKFIENEIQHTDKLNIQEFVNLSHFSHTQKINLQHFCAA